LYANAPPKKRYQKCCCIASCPSYNGRVADCVTVESSGARCEIAAQPAAIVPAAISNAVFDAIGVRLRSVPFTPQKTLVAIKS
jgi:hypothetical protein